MGKSVARVTKPVPPLRAGDRLGVDEFLRRYEADPVVVRAELIGGVVYVHRRREVVNGEERIVPPISLGHGQSQSATLGWLAMYAAQTPGVQVTGPVTTRLSEMAGPEPDGILRIHPDHGGQSTTGADGYIHGAPELIVEVAYSSAAYDLGPKFDAYQADGVKEYIVWRAIDDDQDVQWFVRQKGKFVPLEVGADALYRSQAFPGLWLDPAAFVNRDLSRLFQVIQQGVATPEHAAFVAKLAAAAKRKKKR